MPTSNAHVTFVFVLGTGRCGSTLVQEVLSRHPDVGFVSNVDNALAPLNLKGRFNNQLYRGLPRIVSGRTTLGRRPGWGGGSYPASRSLLELRRLADRFRLWFAPSEAYRLIDSGVSRFVTAPDRDLTTEDGVAPFAWAFRRFFLERARAQHRPVFLHHFTGWPRAGFIHALFPKARFIHVVRDGRAVASSLLRMPWWRGHQGHMDWGFGPLPAQFLMEWEASGRSPALLAGLEWKLLMEATERARRTIPQELWLEVRYEELVAEPRSQTSRLLEHMGLPWRASFEKQFARCSFPQARIGSFRQELQARDLELLETSLSDHLARLGYPLDDQTGRSGSTSR